MVCRTVGFPVLVCHWFDLHDSLEKYRMLWVITYCHSSHTTIKKGVLTNAPGKKALCYTSLSPPLILSSPSLPLFLSLPPSLPLPLSPPPFPFFSLHISVLSHLPT
jgi:hypothetical protein